MEALGGELDVDPPGAAPEIPCPDPDRELAVRGGCLKAERIEAAGVDGRDRPLPFRQRSPGRLEQIEECARIVRRDGVEVITCHPLKGECVHFRGAVTRQPLEIGDIPAEIQVESPGRRCREGCQGDERACRKKKWALVH